MPADPVVGSSVMTTTSTAIVTTPAIFTSAPAITNNYITYSIPGIFHTTDRGSNYVSSDLFYKQIDKIYDSIDSRVDDIHENEDYSSSFETEQLLVTGNAEVVGSLEVGGSLYLDNYTPTSTTNRLYTQAGSLYWNGVAVGGGGAVNLTDLLDVDITTPAVGNVLMFDGADWVNVATSSLGISGGGAGSVTSVAASVPTGFTISGSPVTSSGILAIGYDAGYEGLRSASSSAWNTFYDTPSNRVAAGTGLGWVGNTLSVQDNYILNTGDSISGNLNFSGTAANIALASNYLSGDGDDEGIFIDNNGNVGVGTSTPNNGFVVVGNTLFGGDVNVTGDFSIFGTSILATTSISRLALSGVLLDTTMNVGMGGQLLMTTGTGTQWVSTSTLGFGSSFSNSAQLSILLSDETGIGTAVFSDSPVLTTPNLGTPSTLVGTNITGTASGLTAGNVTTNANLTGAITSVGNAASLGLFTSASLLGALTDETGTGSSVFSISPTFTGITNFDDLVGTNATFISATTSALAVASLTTGRIPFVSTAGRLVDDVNFVFAVTTGNLGIGTSTPSSKLDVYTSNTNPGFETVTVANMHPNGKSTIKVQGDSQYMGFGVYNSNFPVAALRNISAFGGSGSVLIASNVSIASGGSDDIRFSPGGYLSEQMRLTAAGNLGLGTTSPGSKLTVNGSAFITGTTTTNNLAVSALTTGRVVFSATSGRLIDDANLTFTGTDLMLGGSAGLQMNDVLINRGAANRLDLASGDSFNLVLGSIAFSGTTTITASSTNRSYSFGELAGATFTTTNLNNIALGYEAGRFSSTTNVSNNFYAGYRAGYANTGSSSILIGYNAGNAMTGSYNIVLGEESGRSINGTYNYLIGHNVGSFLRGSNNVALGGRALAGVGSPFTVNNNVAIGYRAGFSVDGGANNNILLGYQAADNLVTGANNIIIGYNIDAVTTSASNTLNIGNIIYANNVDGAGTTVSTGNVGIGTSTANSKLSVDGTIFASNLVGGATNLTVDANGQIIRDPSDVRLKTNVRDIENALDTVLQLRGVRYQWLDPMRFGPQDEIGFIAQEVDLIVPEVVSKGGDYWSLNSKNLIAVVVEAIKEIWDKVQQQDERLNALEAENAALHNRLLQLEASDSNNNESVQPEDTDEEEVPAPEEGSNEDPDPQPEVTESENETAEQVVVPDDGSDSETE